MSYISQNIRIGTISELRGLSTMDVSIVDIFICLDNNYIYKCSINDTSSSDNGDTIIVTTSTNTRFKKLIGYHHLLPMTTSEINLITNPIVSTIVYNTTIGVPCFYDGTGWRKVSHSAM